MKNPNYQFGGSIPICTLVSHFQRIFSASARDECFQWNAVAKVAVDSKEDDEDAVGDDEKADDEDGVGDIQKGIEKLKHLRGSCKQSDDSTKDIRYGIPR
eukprot:883005_1